ncbi:MAG TPA: helix-turn-helix domain-containing protein, partial [Acidimicrobiales bacterium]
MGRPRLASDDDILDATARAVSRHGPGQLTLATVAGEAGITAAAILQRFGSKRGLLLALSRRSTAGAAEAVAAALARSKTGSPREALAPRRTGELGAVD